MTKEAEEPPVNGTEDPEGGWLKVALWLRSLCALTRQQATQLLKSTNKEWIALSARSLREVGGVWGTVTGAPTMHLAATSPRNAQRPLLPAPPHRQAASADGISSSRRRT